MNLRHHSGWIPCWSFLIPRDVTSCNFYRDRYWLVVSFWRISFLRGAQLSIIMSRGAIFLLEFLLQIWKNIMYKICHSYYTNYTYSMIEKNLPWFKDENEFSLYFQRLFLYNNMVKMCLLYNIFQFLTNFSLHAKKWLYSSIAR